MVITTPEAPAKGSDRNEAEMEMDTRVDAVEDILMPGAMWTFIWLMQRLLVHQVHSWLQPVGGDSCDRQRNKLYHRTRH